VETQTQRAKKEEEDSSCSYIEKNIRRSVILAGWLLGFLSPMVKSREE
jgi:hypothetical protein